MAENSKMRVHKDFKALMREMNKKSPVTLNGPNFSKFMADLARNNGVPDKVRIQIKKGRTRRKGETVFRV